MTQPIFHLTLEDQSSEADQAAVREGLFAYNRKYAPDEQNCALNVFLRDEAGEIAGGLLGETFWGWLYVSILWVDERARGQGFGARLMAAAEEEAVRRGCRHAYLDTLTFQARPFYEKLGYRLFGVLEDLPPGFTRYFLQKDLAPAETGE